MDRRYWIQLVAAFFSFSWLENILPAFGGGNSAQPTLRGWLSAQCGIGEDVNGWAILKELAAKLGTTVVCGRDECGLWAEIELGDTGATLRLRERERMLHNHTGPGSVQLVNGQRTYVPDVDPDQPLRLTHEQRWAVMLDSSRDLGGKWNQLREAVAFLNPFGDRLVGLWHIKEDLANDSDVTQDWVKQGALAEIVADCCLLRSAIA